MDLKFVLDRVAKESRLPAAARDLWTSLWCGSSVYENGHRIHCTRDGGFKNNFRKISLWANYVKHLFPAPVRWSFNRDICPRTHAKYLINDISWRSLYWFLLVARLGINFQIIRIFYFNIRNTSEYLKLLRII